MVQRQYTACPPQALVLYAGRQTATFRYIIRWRKDDERQTDMQKAPKFCMWGLFRFAVSECHIYAAAPDSAVMGEFNTFSVKDVINAKVCTAVIVDLLINDKV